MFWFLILLILCIGQQKEVFCEEIILKPIKEGEIQVGLIFIQGTGFSTESYLPLVQAIQETSNYSLWVGIPQMPLDIPEEYFIEFELPRLIGRMQEQGFTSEIIFYGGHSAGGDLIQDYTLGISTFATGQILLGSFLHRKHREQYPVSTLTIGGELDGLVHISRIAESYWNSILQDPDFTNATTNFPVVVLEGVTHSQFSSGYPPLFVREYDLNPEITNAQAHKLIAQVVASFLAVQVEEDQPSLNYLSRLVKNTGILVQPIIDAFNQEAYVHFFPPCYRVDPGVKCVVGCPWVEKQAVQLANFFQINYEVHDLMSSMWDITSEHFPQILNKCSKPDKSCNLNLTTVSEPAYNSFNDIDSGFEYQSAYEIRAKYKSRQTILMAAGETKNLDFNLTDGGNLCANLNQQTYDWALENVPLRTYERFFNLGQPYTMGPDIESSGGPFWLLRSLSYETVVVNDKAVKKLFFFE